MVGRERDPDDDAAEVASGLPSRVGRRRPPPRSSPYGDTDDPRALAAGDPYARSAGAPPDWDVEDQQYGSADLGPPPRREVRRDVPVEQGGRPRGRGWRITGAVLGTAALLTMVVLGSYYAGTELGVPQAESREVAIPVLRGQSISDVNNILQQLGLSTVFTAPVYDEQIPLNSVVSTSPPAQTTLRTGDVVTVTYSSGPQPITVPPVVGQPEETANTALTQSGLSPGLRVEQPSTDAPAGSVLRMEPGVGTEVPVGLQITMVISSGPPPVVLPRVIGLTESEAVDQLNAQNIHVEFERRFNSRVEEGRIIDQVPAAGTVAPPESVIILTSSLGP